MFYSEHIPIPELQGIVKTIWVLEDPAPVNNHYEKILPDGCAELIFHLGDPMLQRENGVELKQEKYFVYGQLSRFIELRPSGSVHVIGVKFFPWSLAALIKIPQNEISNQRVLFADIFNIAGTDLTDKIENQKNIGAQIKLIQQFLLNILYKQKSSRDYKALQFAISRLQLSDGNEKIASISNKINISSRELERKFQKNIGLTPKQLARIYHFQLALRLASKSQSLTQLAHTAGYFDQPHFIREFKDIVGISPHAFFREERNLTDVFIRTDS